MNYLRMLVKTRPKEIGVFKTGVKNLINKDMLINYLNGEQIQEEKNSTNIDYGKIRRVCE
ncbi:MAG: hypothetical protein GXY87_07360 [Tissierellia bacterium]|nr:hypothetical protein [Tissierellia bacterium]